MSTILNEIKISGICLMSGRECLVKISPSAKKGIYFYPENSEFPVKASLTNVISAQNFVTLGNAEKQVRVIEHFMAACAFTGIDSLNVYLSSSELPILDGSTLEWVNVFKKAGIQEKFNFNYFEINKSFDYTSENASFSVSPAESLKISYYINFDHPDLRESSYTWNIVDNNPAEIIEARTFGFLKDLEKFQQAGLALGVSIDNTVGLTETGYTTRPRSAYEPIKHKILDLIGDLNLMDINPLNLKAHITARNAGHTSHIKFAEIIQKYLEETSCQLQMKD